MGRLKGTAHMEAPSNGLLVKPCWHNHILVSRQHSIESDFEFPLKTLPSPHTASFQALSVNAFR